MKASIPLIVSELTMLNLRFFKFLILLVVCSLGFACVCDSQSIIPILPSIYRGSDKAPGYAILNNGDTLQGYFYVDFDKGVKFQKEFSKSAKDTVLQKSLFDQIFLKLSDNEYCTNGNNEYVYIEKYDEIYRRIYVGKRKYFDENRTLNTPDGIRGNVLIVQKGDIDSIELINTSKKGPFKTLVDYLNAKWKTDYSYKYFPKSLDVIREIDNRIE